MKADIETKLKTAVDRRLKEIKINGLLEQLVEKNPITLPESMIQAQLGNNFSRLAQQFGMKPEDLAKSLESTGSSVEKFMEGQRDEVILQLKSGLIVDQLKRDHNISVTPEEIEQKYVEIAEQQKMDVEEVKKHYADPRAKEYLIDDAKDDKLFDELFKDVKLAKGDKKSAKEIFER